VLCHDIISAHVLPAGTQVAVEQCDSCVLGTFIKDPTDVIRHEGDVALQDPVGPIRKRNGEQDCRVTRLADARPPVSECQILLAFSPDDMLAEMLRQLPIYVLGESDR